MPILGDFFFLSLLIVQFLLPLLSGCNSLIPMCSFALVRSHLLFIVVFVILKLLAV